MKRKQFNSFYLSVLLVFTVFGTSLSQKMMTYAEEEPVVLIEESGTGELEETGNIGEREEIGNTGETGTTSGGSSDGGTDSVGSLEEPNSSQTEGTDSLGGTPVSDAEGELGGEADGDASGEAVLTQITEDPVALTSTPMMRSMAVAATESSEPVLAASATSEIPSGLNETQETYSVPSGSVTIQGIEETYSNDSTSNAIQKAVEKAIQYATVNTSHTSTIVVKNGTYEGGLTIDATEQSSLGQLLAGYISEAVAGGGSVTKEDIVLRIIAEDIIGENGSLLENTYSSGDAQMIGDINISGLNVMLAGIYLSTKGSLSIKDAGSFEYIGTVQDDRVSMNIDNVSDGNADTTDIKIDSGGGDDDVEVSIVQAPTYSIGISKGSYETLTDGIASLPMDPTQWTQEQITQVATILTDLLKQEITIDTDNLSTQKNEILIELGTGNDQLDAKLINSTNFTADFLNMETLAVDETLLGFKLDLSKTALTILGQDGNDEIALSGGMALDIQYQFAQKVMDELNISLFPDLSDVANNSTAVMDGGGGDDLIILDTTAPFSSYRECSYQITDTQGADRLHLTGKLDGTVTDRINVEESAAGDIITVKSLAQISFPIISYSLDKKKDLNLVVKGIEMYTDELANKNQVNLSTASGTAVSYTDYILDTIGADGSIDFNLGLTIPNGGLRFSNVIAEAPSLIVNRFVAVGMNVFMNAVSITVNGIISCVNLIINAVPEAILELSQGLVENDLELEDNLGIEFTVTGTDSEAKILVTADGDVRTTGGVFLKAENIQDKFYIDSSLLSGNSLNHFSYKDANSIIVIEGKIDSTQAIRVESILCILLDGDEQLLEKVIPFSVQIATGSSTITVGGKAIVDSQASVFLKADSYIHITSTAHAGLAPVAIALAVATPVTYVVIREEAAIRADGDVILKADSITRTIDVATGKKANSFAMKAQSGGFIALTVIDQETYVKVLDQAKIESLGNISLLSITIVRSDTAAISIPADDSTGTIKTKSAIKYAESLLGVKKANNQSLIGKVVTMITGSNFLGNLFTSGTSGAEKESSTTTTPKSTTQLMGSLGVAYVVNENLVLIDTSNKVSATDKLELGAYARTDSFVKADGSLYKTPSPIPGVTPEEEPDRALGIGVTVVYYHHGNNAQIRNGLIFADGILLDAQSGYSSSVAISKSGHIPTKNAQLGVGGAITVHIVSDQTQAILGNLATYHIKSGDVVVTASAIRDYVTVADASGKRTNITLNVAGITIPITSTEYNKSGTGIGAGIAVAIIGGDVLAQMEDGVILIHDGAVPMNSIQVDAKSKITENTYAAAGAGSSTAIVPVIATDISGFSTQAVLGSGTTIDFLQTDAIVMADSSIVRTLASDAAAVGTGVGVGGSFAVSVYHDSTKAYMNRSVNARNIMVSAKSIDRMNGKAKASATGAAPPAASTPTTTTTASTTEGVPDGDAEPIANLQKKGEADKIADQNLAAASTLSDKSNTKNVNKSSVDQMSANRQQAQTSEGNVQVAAAFAVNIMKHMVLAEIGSGLILIARAISGEAASGAISVIAKEDTDAILAANASATKSEIGVGVAVAVNVVTTENKAIIGKSKIQAKTLLIQADSIESKQKKTVEEILDSLITYLVSVEGIDLIINVIKENLAGDETLEQLVTQELMIQNAKLDPEKQHTEQELLADKEAANEAIKAVLVAKMKNEETAEISSDLVKAVVDSLMEELFDTLLTPSTIIDLLITKKSDAITAIMSKAALTAEVTAARIEEAVVAYMRSRFGGNDEADGLGSKISTSAVSGAGASNIGIAGAVAVTVLTAISQALILDLDTALAEDITVTDGVVISSDRFQKLYTTATGSADKQGAPDKNKNATGTQSSSKSVGVGAAAAVSIVDATSEAGIGKNRTVKAGSLDIRANLTNDLETVAVAGQDPIAHREAAAATANTLGKPFDPNSASNATSTKSISVDAAAAVGVITNTVRAYVDENTKVITTGSDTNDQNNDIETIAESGKAPELVNLYLYSGQTGETYTSASAFACGTTTAVGAAVAVNLATSDVESAFLGQGELAGNAKLDARTFDADESHALASVSGANAQRYLEKISNVLKYMSPGTYPPTGSINAGIVNKLNILANPVVSGVTGLTNNMPLSSSAMSSQKTATTDAPDTTKAQTTANQNTKTPVAGQPVKSTTSKEKSINIAAAVAVNVTKHMAHVLQKGIIQARMIALNAKNQGNFLTKGSGATVTPLSNNTSNLSLGVAVTTNSNQALVTINGELVALGDQATVKNDGDITVNATLTQNMDGKYKGLLAAQAIAGSVSGSGGTVNASGAVAVMTGNAKTIILITDGSSLRGGAITINAIDKSKYAIRAGSANISTGAKAAIGASFALIYAQNITKIQIGDTTGLIGVLIEADSLTINAVKEKVDQSDYQIPFDESTLFTVDASSEKEKGLINLTTTEGSSGKYSVSVTLGVDDLLKAIDLLNYLSSVNYYAEAIAGTIVAGNAQVAVAGSMAMVFLTNETTSEIGKNVTIMLSDHMTQTAKDSQNSRIISGALSASKANVGVGLTVGYLSNDTKVSALIGDDTKIQALSILSSAKVTTDIWVITTAASVVLGSGGAAIGGAITAVDSGNQVLTQTGNNVTLKAVDSIQLVSQNNQALTLISASVSGSGSVALGGTVAVIVIEDETTAQTGAYNNLQAGSFIKVSAQEKEDLLNVLASLSGSTGAVAVAGTLGVIIAQSQTIAQAGNHNTWNATNGDILILADSKIDQMFILATAAGSTGQAAVGATVTVYVFNQKVKAMTGSDSHFTAGRNIVIQATGANDVLLVTVAGAAGEKGAVSGAIPVVVMTTQTLAETGSGNTLKAQDSVGVVADQNNQLISVAGSFSGGGNVGVGATIHTAIMNNNVKASTGDDSHITGYAMNTATDAGIKLPGENRTQRRHGVIVNANNNSTIFMLSASGAASGNVSVTGVVNTLLVNNQVEASIGKNTAVNAREFRSAANKITSSESDLDSDSEADVEVEASDDTDIILLAGGVSVSGSVGVGATIAVTIIDNTVTALIKEGSHIYAADDIQVLANADTKLTVLLLAFGVAGSVGVAGAVSVILFENKTQATVQNDSILIAGDEIQIKASQDNQLISVAAGIAGGEYAGVVAVAPIVKFLGTTSAMTGDFNILTAGGNILVAADSKETIITAGMGLGGGIAGVGGTFELLIMQVVTKAYTGKSNIISGNQITIQATDHYALTGAAGTVTGGAAGVGLSLLVSLSYNTVTAYIGENSQVTALSNILVRAESDRQISAYAVTAGAGGAAVSGTVVVVLAGSKLNQESYADINNSSIKPQSNVEEAFSKSDSRTLKYSREDEQGNASDADVSAYLDQRNVSQTSVSSGSADGNNLSIVSEDSAKNSTADTTGTTSVEDIYAEKEDANGNSTVDSIANADSNRPAQNLKDTTSAFIGAGSIIKAAGNISVIAIDNTTLDIITGAVAIGGGAGVGIGASIVILYSNVLAFTQDESVLEAGGSILVQAVAGSVAVNHPDSKTVESGKAGAADPYTIRVITVVGAAGFGGTSLSLAIASVDIYTMVEASIGSGSKIRNAANVTVTADSNYGLLQVITAGVSAGNTAIVATISRANYDAVVRAAIESGVVIDKINGTLAINLNSDTMLQSDTISAGGGIVAANAAVALAFYTMRADAYIGQGVIIHQCGTINLLVDVNAITDAKILSITAGGVAVGANVVLIKLTPVILNYIGSTPVGYAAATGSNGTNGSIHAKDITLSSHVTSKITAFGIAGGLGVASLNGSVVIAMNRTASIVAITGMNLVAEDILIDAGMDTSSVVTNTAISGGVITAGLVVGYAETKAVNKVYLDASNATIQAKSLTIYAGQQTDKNESLAQVTLLTGAVSAAAVSINAAVAVNEFTNQAMLLGKDATIQIAQTVLIEENMTAMSQTIVTGVSLTGVSVSALVALSFNRADGKSYIWLTGVNQLTADKIVVHSYLNQDTGIQAAKAQVYSGSGSLIGVNGGVALAAARAQNQAYAKGNLKATNEFAVQASGTTNANAVITAVSAAIVSVGIMMAGAYAEGVNISWMQADEGVIEAGSILIDSSQTADSYAEVMAGALGYVVVKVNVATAIAAATTKAYITGTGGRITSHGNLVVNANGTSKVTAVTKGINGSEITIGGYQVTGNVAVTSMASQTMAYIDGFTIIKTDGDLRVLATYQADSDVEAQSSAGLSLVNVNGAVTNSKASSITKAFITGNTIETGGTILIQAVGHANSEIRNTKAPNLSILGIGVVVTYSDVTNTVQAFVGSGSKLTALGSIQIIADGNANVSLHSVTSGGGLIDGNSVVLIASAKQVTNAQVMNLAVLKAQGDILIHAAGRAKTYITILDIGIGAIRIGAYVIDGIETLDTQILIGENSNLYANGKIELEAMDKLDATSLVTLYGAGLASGTASITRNTGNQIVWITVGKNSKISSGNDISITTATDHQMNAEVTSSNIGLASVAAAVATNILTRNNTITIQDGSSILASGNSIIAANSMPTNRDAAIRTVATGGSAGLFEVSGAKAESRLYANTDIIIGNGVIILTTYGDVDISAVSGSSSYTKAFRSAAQVVTKNTTEAIVFLKDYVSVKVATGSNVLTTIIGQNVALSAIINLQKIFAQSGSTMYAVGALTTAITDVEIWSGELISIGAANIRGYESVSLIAMTQEVNHMIRSDSEIIGVLGVVKATTNVRGRMNAEITTDEKTEIASADVLIQAFAPTMKNYAHTATAEAVANTVLQKVLKIIGYVVKWIAKAVAWFVGLFSKKAKKKILEAVYGWVDELVSSTAISNLNDSFSSDATIDLNGKISVGGAAAGIVVDIAADGTVSATGMEVAGWSNGVVVDHINKTITIPYLYNAKSGSLNIDAGTGELKGQLAVYLNNYLTYVTINNHSDYDLIVSDITVFNTDVNAFTYTVNAATNKNTMTTSYGDETPVVSINAEKDTNIIFNGEMNNVKGELNLNLNGGNVLLGDGAYTNKDEILRGDTEFLTKMFEGTSIWTNSLKITGATNVGQSAAERLAIGIVRYSGSNTAGRIVEPARNGKVWIEATGNIYVSLALLEVLISKEALSDTVLENQEPIDRLYLEKIKAGKTADIYLPIAKRLYVYENGIDYEGMEITSPGEYEELFILTPDQSILDGNMQLVILNAKGQDSGYRLGADGLITLNGELSLDASVFDMKTTTSITIGDTVMELRLYRLTDGSSVYVTSDGKVMLISSTEHTLNLTQFTYDLSTNRILLNDTDNLTDSYITFDANNIPIMHIGTNGITMYVQQNADGSWTLPNGIKIYMLFALLNQNNEIVTSTYLGTDANNYRSFMIGSINDGTDTDVFYVYQVATIEGKQSFIASQKYQKTLKGTPVYGQIERKQTLEEAKAAAQIVINSYLSAGSVLTVAQLTQLQTEIAAAVTDQIEVTLTLTQLRTISEKTTDVAGKEIKTYQSSYVLFVNYTLNDLYEMISTQILDTQIALGQTPYLEDVLEQINNTANQSDTSVGGVTTVIASGTSMITGKTGTIEVTQTQQAMTTVEAKNKVNAKLPITFIPESGVALSNLAETLQGELTENIGISLEYTMTKNADYSYTCKVTITLSDGTTSTTISKDYIVAGILMSATEAKESMETSMLTSLDRSDISQNTVATVIAKAQEIIKENIQVTATLNRKETILQTEHAYRYDYELEIIFINLADTSNDPAISTASYLSAFAGLAFMLSGTTPVVTQIDPQKADAVNLKTQASTTDGTVIWISDGYGYTIRPDSVPGAADLYVKENKSESGTTTYQLRVGSKTTNLERLDTDGEYVNYRIPITSDIAGGAYYIFSIHSQGTGSYLKLYDLTTKGEAGSKLVGGDHVFENGTKFLTNRIIALYPGSLTTSGKEQIVYVSLSAASEAVMGEERTLENSVIYLSLLTNQKQYVDDFGQSSPLYKDVSKRLIYQAASATEYESIAEKQIGDVKYFLRGYIEYVNGTENYHYIRYTFDNENPVVKEDLTLITDLTQINNLTQQYLEYYNELFKTSNKVSVIFDTESVIIFDTSKGGGIVLNPNGTIYYQPGILLNPDGTTQMDSVLRTTSLGEDENGNYYVNKNQRIRVTQNASTGEATIQMLYLEDSGNVYAIYDLKTGQMKWLNENGYTTFNTKTFTSSPVILSAGTKLTFSKVTDSVLTIMNGSEFFYYETEKDVAGNESLTQILYAGDRIDLIQLSDGTFTEVKEIIEETATTYTLRVADSGSKTKEKIVTFQKSELVEGQILSAVSVRDEEYNPVMMAIRTTMGSYYIFPNGYTFGILTDGEAVFFQSEIVIEKLRHTETVLGSTYLIGNIEAQTVILTIQDAQAIIRDSGLFEAAITGNDIQIVTDANLGETNLPIRINTLEPVMNLNQKGLVLKGLMGTGAYTKDAYLQGVINPIRMSAIRLADSAHLILDAGNLDAYLEILTDMKDRTQRITIDHVKNLFVNGTTPNQMIYLIIEEMSGTLNLKNSGPAEVVVNSGNLVIGEINSNENALYLEAKEGGIETEGNLPVNLRAGRITLKAKQQIALRVNGNLTIQQMLAGGKVTLIAPSGLILGSTNQPVIEAPELVIEAMGIGLASRPLWMKIMGSLVLKAVQNIFIKQTGTALTGQIDAGGMLNLETDGDIGSSTTPLEMNVEGAVFARANRIYFHTPGNLIIGTISAKELLQIIASGSITAGSVSSILTADEGNLVSLSGDLGTRFRPLRTSFGKLSVTANNIYLNNLNSLQIGQLTTNQYEEGQIFLQVAGNLTGEDGKTHLKAVQQPHLNAEQVELLIYGNAGTLQHPLAIMTDRLYYSGIGRAYIHLLNLAPESVEMESEEQLMLEADGSLEKGVLKSEKVTLTAVLAIGLIEAPVLIYTNLLEITSGIDEMYYKLFKYVRPVKKQDIIENGQETGLLLSTLLAELKKEIPKENIPLVILQESTIVPLSEGGRGTGRTKQSIVDATESDSRLDERSTDRTGDGSTKEDATDEGNAEQNKKIEDEATAKGSDPFLPMQGYLILLLATFLLAGVLITVKMVSDRKQKNSDES